MSPIIGSFASGGSFGKRGEPPLTQLYPFSEVTFTAALGGYNGPSLAQAKASLSGPEVSQWKDNTSFFNVSGGIQYWTVPNDGIYRIEAWGAQSWPNSQGGGATVGYGSRMRGDFTLTGGEILRILVGQTGRAGGVFGPQYPYGTGGGGGTFVVRSPYNTNASILVIAGGAGGGSIGAPQGQPAPIQNPGGAGVFQPGSPYAPYFPNGGGTSGGGGGTNRGSNQHGGGAGGGFFGNANDAGSRPNNYFGRGGISFVNGGIGGHHTSGYGGHPYANISNINGTPDEWFGEGGFGGGGSVDHGGGGGGGYSGGSGSDYFYGSGGGGGSYNSAPAPTQSNATGSSTDGRPTSAPWGGRVKITLIG